jgi:hypothetical protein
MSTTSASKGWSLEVVRGRDVGRTFALNGRGGVLGNALGTEAGIDLSEQEGNTPRRMAAKQATIECSVEGLVIRDLDSPGGTFVNRQRILPGQARRLVAGDVIQLGAVQLRVVDGVSAPAPAAATASPVPAAAPAAKPAAPPTGTAGFATPFVLASGATCRNWDDFLTVAAQRWAAMRDELISGRLAGFFASMGQIALAPSPQAPGSPDERLDAWLASLPTTRPSKPELEVHPQSVTVRSSSGGGTTRRTVHVTNVGYRLLRSSVRVEPADTAWLKLAPEFARGPFTTIEQTEVAFDVELPDSLDRPRSAAIVIDGNGGTRRVEVRVERATAVGEPAEPSGRPVARYDVWSAIAGWSIPVRVALGAGVGLLLRLLVAGGTLLLAGAASGTALLPLRGPLIMMVATGALAAGLLVVRRSAWADLPVAAFAGAVAGALVAAIVVAVCRVLEPPAIAAMPLVACLAWTIAGAVIAGGSAWGVPYRKKE